MKELFTPVWTERERKGKVPDENCYSKSVLRWMTGWKQGESLLANILGISSKSASDGGWDETRAKRFRERKESFNILKRQIPLQREWLSQNTGHTAPPCSEKWRPGHGTLPPGWKDTFKAVMCILSLAFDILRRESSQTNKKMSLFQTVKFRTWKRGFLKCPVLIHIVLERPVSKWQFSKWGLHEKWLFSCLVF